LSLKLQPIRVSQLCLRSAYLHQGNALSALGRDKEAREVYSKVLPMLSNEPRCGRVDWERSSIYINIGNTYSRSGEYDEAMEQFKIAEKLGQDHIDAIEGNVTDGMGIVIVAKRARAFALKKAGKEDDAKQLLRDVLEMQKNLSAAEAEQKKKEKEIMEKSQEKQQLQQQQEEQAEAAAAEVSVAPTTEPAGQQLAVA
jgi:tetratricopeptide (TPR) repeat protein